MQFMHRQCELPPRTMCVRRMHSLRRLLVLRSHSVDDSRLSHSSTEWNYFIDWRWDTIFRKCPFNHFAHAWSQTVSGWQDRDAAAAVTIPHFVSINFCVRPQNCSLGKCWRKPRRCRQSNSVGKPIYSALELLNTLSQWVPTTINVRSILSARICRRRRQSHLPSYGFCVFTMYARGLIASHTTHRSKWIKITPFSWRKHTSHRQHSYGTALPHEKPSGSRYCFTKNFSGIPSRFAANLRPNANFPPPPPLPYRKAIRARCRKMTKKALVLVEHISAGRLTRAPIFHQRKLIKSISGPLCAPVLGGMCMQTLFTSASVFIARRLCDVCVGGIIKSKTIADQPTNGIITMCVNSNSTSRENIPKRKQCHSSSPTKNAIFPERLKQLCDE